MKYFTVPPEAECPFCPTLELKMESMVMQRALCRHLHQLTGNWWSVQVLVWIGLPNQKPVMNCSGEVYLTYVDGLWSIPDTPDRCMKDFLHRVINILIADPEEYKEAIRIITTAALGVARDPTHYECSVWRL